MPKITAEEQKDLAVVPDDTILHLKVEEISIETIQGNRGPWDKMEIKFKVLGIQATGDGSPVEDYDSLVTGPIWGSVPFKLTDSAENKLRLWTEAILSPVQVGVGFELDTDLFIGREVRGVTGTYEKTKSGINPQTGKPFLGHKVLSLLPKDGSAAATGGWGGGQAQASGQPSGWSSPPPGAADPWATPAETQQPAAAQQPQSVPAAAGGGDPWASQGWEGDEPPF